MIGLGIIAASKRRAAAPSGGYAATVLADSPLAYWRMSEASGTVAADSSGNNRNLSLADTGRGAASLIPGDPDPSWTVGAGGATLPRADWMAPAAWTAEALIHPTANSSYRGIITFDSTGGTGRGWNFYMFGGRLHIYQWNPRVELSGATLLALNTTHHVALTYDGTTARIYLNGIQDGSWAVNLIPNANPVGLVVGASYAGTPTRTLEFGGRIDEPAFYGSALPAARILAHAQAAGVA